MAGPRVAVFSPNTGAPSETFIRAHIERLPLETVPIYGGGWRRAGVRGPLWPLLRFPGALLRSAAPTAGSVLYARALARTLRRQKIDVALAEYGTTGVEIQDACRRAGVPLVVYFYGFDAWRNAIVDRYLPDYRRMFAGAAAIIAVSDSIRERLLEWGAPAAKVHHVVCGADPVRFSGAAPEKASPHFVAVGRFTDKKGPLLTLRAFGDAAVAEPAARLSMVGDGPLLDATRRLASDLGLQDRVAFTGVRAPGEVAELYRTARAFVQHSVSAADGDREGTPVAIVEAQMAGLPVVSTLHSGIPEIVVDGETAMLVKERDAAGMGRAMTRLAGDPALAGAMGRAARERAMAHFSQERTLGALADVLARAASVARP